MIDVQIINTKPVVIEVSANGGIASGGVQTVTGFYVNNTDPQNPSINIAPLEARVEDLEAILNSQTNFTGYAYAVWAGTGLVFNVFWPAYYIQGVRYEADSGTITLDAADVTNPRLDVIGVDSTGVIKITGTPSTDPVKPTVDPSTQLEITTVLIAANATTPTEITNEDIYSENIEWTGSSNNGTVLFNDTTDPFAGTMSVSCEAFDDTHYIRFLDGVTHNKSSFSVLAFALKLKSLWSGGTTPTYLKVKFLNSGIAVSSTISILSGSYNFSRAGEEYQTIVIPISEFTFSSPTFDELEFTFTGLNPDGFYLDNILLQTGAATVSPAQIALVSIETDSGTANATTADDTFQLIGADGLVVSAVGKTITITPPSGGGGGGGHTIQDEGTPLTQRTNLNFVGSTVTVTDDSGNDATLVTISGGTIVGTDTQVMFFDGANNPAGDAGMTYDKISNVLITDGHILNAETAARVVILDSSKNIKASNHSISGDVITFAAFPEKSGTPTTDDQLVNKLYVDSQVIAVTDFPLAVSCLIMLK